MRISYSFIIMLLLIGCDRNNPISYNPFEPNTNLKTKTILSNGFELKWGCDGGVNSFSLETDTFELVFYEDCLHTGKIIGENYLFYLDHCANYRESDDSLRIDFNQYRKKIATIVHQYGGEIIEPAKLENFGYFRFQVINMDGNILDCDILCYPNGQLKLVIENWYWEISAESLTDDLPDNEVDIDTID